MSHKAIVEQCERLGLAVGREPSEGRRDWSATGKRVRVYWSASFEGGLLGLPRVIRNGVDTHARSLREIEYLVSL